MIAPPKTSPQKKNTEGKTADVEQPKRRFTVDQIIRYENGEMEQHEIVELFQLLVDTGDAWSLQGHYGRVAMHLIEAGLVIPHPSKGGITG